MNTTNDRLIVAVDGGGSTCRVQLRQLDGVVVGQAVGDSANITTNLTESIDTITATIHAAYADGGHSTARMPGDIAFLGLAGANVGNAAQVVADTLEFERVEVTSDRETTVQGALDAHDGLVAHVGTGSFFSVRRDGKTRHVGGWGFQLSDDCSGAHLGRKLLRAVIEAYDGMRHASPLTRQILDQFGGTPDQLVSFIQTATPADYGAFVPELLAAQTHGDPLAIDILRAATARMIGILDTLEVKRAGRLCFVGGLGATYQAMLPADYATLCAPPLGGAMDGAFALALRAIQDDTP